MVYIGRSDKPGAPLPGYMEGVVEAAQHAGLPADYIKSLGIWLPRTQSSVPAAQGPKVRPLWSAPSGTIRKTR